MNTVRRCWGVFASLAPLCKTSDLLINCRFQLATVVEGWLGSRVVSVLDSSAERPGFKSQPRRCRVTVLGKLFPPIVPLRVMAAYRRVYDSHHLAG